MSRSWNERKSTLSGHEAQAPAEEIRIEDLQGQRHPPTRRPAVEDAGARRSAGPEPLLDVGNQLFGHRGAVGTVVGGVDLIRVSVGSRPVEVEEHEPRGIGVQPRRPERGPRPHHPPHPGVPRAVPADADPQRIAPRLVLVVARRQDDAGPQVDPAAVKRGQPLGTDPDEAEVRRLVGRLLVGDAARQSQLDRRRLVRVEGHLPHVAVEVARRIDAADVAVGRQHRLHAILAGRQIAEGLEGKRGRGGSEGDAVARREGRGVDPDRGNGAGSRPADEEPRLHRSRAGGRHRHEQPARRLGGQRRVEGDHESQAGVRLLRRDEPGRRGRQHRRREHAARGARTHQESHGWISRPRQANRRAPRLAAPTAGTAPPQLQSPVGHEREVKEEGQWPAFT